MRPFLAALALLVACSEPKPAGPTGSNPYTDTDTDTDTDADVDTDTDTDTTPTVPQGPEPLAIDDAAFVDEGGQTVIDVLANDLDNEGDIAPNTVVIASAPTHGSAMLTPTGVGYRHDGSEVTSDSFTYTVSDAAGNESNEATVTITVSPVNDPPIAVDDVLALYPGQAAAVDVVANDTDADDGVNTTTVTITRAPTHGTAVPDITGTVLYTHDGTAGAFDSFEYTVEDFAGATSNDGVVAVSLTGAVLVYVGSYNVGDGPAWGTNPPVYNCLEGCAINFGGAGTDYMCSTSAATIDNQGYVSGWGDGTYCTTPVAEDFKLDQGGGYNCGAFGCSYSAWVSDHCGASFNHCWQ